jgi:hypothetical protein
VGNEHQKQAKAYHSFRTDMQEAMSFLSRHHLLEPSLARLAACRFLLESSSVFFSTVFLDHQC